MNIDQDRIVFTGNIARFNPAHPGRSNQIQNINWLRHIVSPHLEILCEKPIKTVLWDVESDSSNDLYKFLGVTPEEKSYLDIYSGHYNLQLHDLLLPMFKDSLVIGFEMPPFMINFFNGFDIPYVDVILGPLRFFPDLVPAIRSNVSSVTTVLSRNYLSEEEIRVVAAWRKAFFAKKRLTVFPQGTALLIGQTSFDTSQVSEGRFVELNEFEHEISALSRNGNVLFKPHPYALKTDRKRQTSLMKILGISVVEDNVYHLLNCPGISEVVSISSSVTRESPYFGVPSRTLIDYPFHFAEGGNHELNRFYNIFNKLGSTQFWADLLDRKAGSSYSLATGALAQSLGQNWGSAEFASEPGHEQGLAARIAGFVKRL
jgi:hypothetical protein